MAAVQCLYAFTAALIIGLAAYGLFTVRHLVKMVSYFILATSGVMLFSTLLRGPTVLPYLVIIISAIEEMTGLAIVITYYNRRKRALIYGIDQNNRNNR